MTEAATAPAVFRFGRCELRASERVLLAGGAPAALGARAFDVLLALVERRDRVVAKNELLELVWPGLVVEENNLQVQISTLRKLLGPRAIATIPGRGYRFVEAVEGTATASGGAAAPSTAPPLPPSNLPVEPPLLFGREREVAEVGRLVREHRLVTLAGAGGIGKTQLARAVAHALRGAFADGVWSIELSPIADAESVFGAVARALDVGLPAGRPRQQVLAEALAGEQLLLVLDRIAQLAQALLAHAPGVHVLATSQEPLKLPAEHQYRLGTLAVPSSSDMATALQYGAVALFTERARAIDPRFALTAQNLPAVIDICRHLDGIPLAIELAAARVPLLGINGLLERLGERFRVLTAGSRIALRRHQTLHAALDWSHGLLLADEQAILRRLGVFAGGWTLEAAQQVAADERIEAWAVLEHLGALVDKSLVVAQGAEAPRYTLLEPALDQARERRRPAGNVAWGLGILVLALAELGRLDAARERLRQGLPLWRADDIVRVWLPAAIRLLAAEGRIAAAARLLGANEGGEHKEGSGGLMARVDAESLRLIEAAEPDAAQRECWRREGEALTEDEIAALCLGDANSAR